MTHEGRRSAYIDLIHQIDFEHEKVAAALVAFEAGDEDELIRLAYEGRDDVEKRVDDAESIAAHFSRRAGSLARSIF